MSTAIALTVIALLYAAGACFVGMFVDKDRRLWWALVALWPLFYALFALAVLFDAVRTVWEGA